MTLYSSASEMLMTATVLLSALATKSIFSSLSAMRALGVEPSGALGYMAVEI